ncbi:MAG: hypothetical protein AB7J32_26355 [Pseudonocardia sp.]
MIPRPRGVTRLHRSNGHHDAVLQRAVASAFNPLEAAVVLESAGVNDRVARERFGVSDVFALADAEFTRRDLPDRVAEPAGGTRAAVAGRPSTTRWFSLRGPLYAVPGVVALALLPTGDHVETALLLGGLVLSWAWGYGMSYIAWAYVGNLEPAAARRFLHRSIVVGILVASVVAVVAVFASLIFTMTVHVSLWTVLLLVGQTAYLLGAVTLLMTGHESRLLIAVAPALVGTIAGLWDGLPVAAISGPGQAGGPEGFAMAWLGASVVLTVVLALFSSRDGAPPGQPLPEETWSGAARHAAYGLFIALLVLYPAFNELLNENFESLPVSVTLAALPLVVGMGIAELLLYDHRRDVRMMLTSTGSPDHFATGVRRALLRTHLQFIAALGAMTVALGGLGVVAFDLTDGRYLLLAVDYLVLGVAIFSAMVLNMLGRITTVLVTLGSGTALLLAFNVAADYRVPDAAAMTWHGFVALALFAAHALLVRRLVSRTTSHW